MNELKIFVAESENRQVYDIASDMYEKCNVEVFKDEEDLKSYYYMYGYLCSFFHAWKNVTAEYKGVYLDNQYFSFSDKIHNEFEKCRYLNSDNVYKYALDDETLFMDNLRKYDGVVCHRKKIDGRCADVARRHLILDRGESVNKEIFSQSLEVIKLLYPGMYEGIKKYFDGNIYLNGNSFILKNELFDRMAEWVFSILKVLGKKITKETSSILTENCMEQIGHLLIEGYLYLLLSEDNCGLKETDIVDFVDVSPEEIVRPAFEENNVSVLLVSSEFYMPYTTTCIYSIMENMSPEFNYDILVMQSSLSDESKTILDEMCEDVPNLKIRYVDLKRYLFKYHLSVSSRITKDIFYRTIAPFVLTEYKKMVVLDTDLVVNRDIADLYQTEIDDYSVAATRDIVIAGFLNGANETERDYYFNECVLSNPFDYINTGVMLQNYVRFREKYECEKFMNFFQEKSYHVQEQDCMNLLLDGDIKFIDIGWNINSYNYSRKKYTIENAPRDFYLEYLEARKNPWIMHWPGSVKPWDKPDVDMARYFWKYARKAPMYEIILERIMKKGVENRVNQVEQQVSQQISVIKNTKETVVVETVPERKKLNVVIFPYNSRRREFIKKIYYLFHENPYENKEK